jgi:prophage antirepressor-like protein
MITRKNLKQTNDFKLDIDSGAIQYCDQSIKINTLNGELWLKAKDIIKILGYKNTKKTLKYRLTKY